jgi:DNA-binding CsgD family transcriptional regulator/PAS domain-containing protein
VTPPEQMLDAVYGAIVDERRWQGALDEIRAALEGRLATLAIIDRMGRHGRTSTGSGDPLLLDQLQTLYAGDVPFYRAIPFLEPDVAYTVDALYAIQGPGARQDWLSARIVEEWVVPNQLDDFVWLDMGAHAAGNGALVVMTDRERRPISRADLIWAEALSPHMRRAVAISELFQSERAAAQIFRRVLESLSQPVLILCEDMRVLFANAAAEQLLDEGVLAAVRGGRLEFAFAHASAAIARAVTLGVRDEFQMGAAGLNVPLAVAKTVAVAHVLPLTRRDEAARLSSSAAAAVFIAAPGVSPKPAIDAVAALFGLTPAEKRVAAQIADGLSRKDIALANGVSDGTVKTQLANIFDKTGTHDQRQLELLVRELSPSVKTPV